MASYGSTVGGGYRLQAEYTYTQDSAANKTKITQKLYWMSLGSQYTVSSSASKSGWQEINGSRGSFSGAGLASLRGNQKKLLDTHIIDVSHNAEGEKTVLLEASFSPEVSLGGWVGTIPISKSVKLPTIPRDSTLTSSRNWTAGNNLGISISRNSSAYDHKIEVIVDGTSIVTRENINTSANIYFTEAQNKSIFTKLNGSASKPAQIKLTTYKGSTQIGSTKTYSGTVTAPASSTTTSSMDFNIGASRTITVKRVNDNFTHTLRFYTNNTLIKTVTGVETEYIWNPSSAEITSMYNSMKTTSSATSKVEIDTFYSGTKVRSTTSKTGTVKVANSNPVFSNGFTYKDINPASVNLTGNDQFIVQRMSDVQVTIPVSAKATPQNGASIVKYQATIQGVVREVTHSDTLEMKFPSHGTLSVHDNTTIQVKAIDSRGNSTTTTRTLNMLPFDIPVMTVKAERVSGFEETTKLFLNGTFSLLNVNGINKNSIQALQYRHKLQSESSYTEQYNNFTYTTNGDKYTATTVNLTLDSTKAYDIEVKLQDKFGTYITWVKVNSGQPILFVDDKLKSVGIGKFPVNPNSFETNGTIYLPNSRYLEQDGGICANNSDITDLQGLYFRDTSEGGNEGLNFLKSGKPVASRVNADYDNFYILDGVAYLNNAPLFSIGSYDKNILYNGGTLMGSRGTIVRPTRNLQDCPNGWVLVWSDWNVDDPNKGINNYNVVHIPIFKSYVSKIAEGQSHLFNVPIGEGTNITTVAKSLYVYNDRLEGHDINDSDNSMKDVALRMVISF